MSSDPSPTVPSTRTSPIAIVCVGMAGSGKTTFVHRLYLHLQSIGKRVYAVNLDPAVKNVPYPTNIDIRDTVDYKKVMKEFTLGPNGAMITSLNLFATKFDQVIDVLEKRANDFDYILVDTPGQIEVFNWSASGQIILDSLAVSFPIVTAYCVDTVRCRNPTTFMSSMTYACSIMYKTKLPFVLVFNKIDIMPCDFAQEWMTEFDKFLAALKPDESGYMASLSRALCLAMEEFYSELRTVGVSSITGKGMEELDQAIEAAIVEYHESYVPYLEHQREQMAQRRDQMAERQLNELKSTGAPMHSKDETDDHEDEDEDLVELEKLRKLLKK
ncbi:hydrolase [Perkinsus sp. BL_2016]|nr:hydrolase [Perkinsus sp. BL_2016]